MHVLLYTGLGLSAACTVALVISLWLHARRVAEARPWVLCYLRGVREASTFDIAEWLRPQCSSASYNVVLSSLRELERSGTVTHRVSYENLPAARMGRPRYLYRLVQR